MREGYVKRKTAETDIELVLNLDGSGKHKISTGVGFFDHMLTAFAVHSGFDLTLTCKGDLEVDCHHSVRIPVSLWARPLPTPFPIKRASRAMAPLQSPWMKLWLPAPWT